MEVPVVGFDPSMTHWGIAEGTLDMDTGYLTITDLQTVVPVKLQGKQVRQNSQDIRVAKQLAAAALAAAKGKLYIFAEVPVGSQSARGMASYAMCIGILGMMQATGATIIEVTPLENKLNFTGDKNATKKKMIDQGVSLYPDAPWPRQRGRIVEGTAEHMADAIAAIHAGVQTQQFQSILQLVQTIK